MGNPLARIGFRQDGFSSYKLSRRYRKGNGKSQSIFTIVDNIDFEEKMPHHKIIGEVHDLLQQ
jgi:hypothetical protein